jgi:hypothetical protein
MIVTEVNAFLRNTRTLFIVAPNNSPLTERELSQLLLTMPPDVLIGSASLPLNLCPGIQKIEKNSIQSQASIDAIKLFEAEIYEFSE